MTRKDYVRIARAMADSRPRARLPPGYPVWVRCVENLATQLKLDNPRFDIEKFMKACEE